MDWTMWALAAQTVAGFHGAHAAASAAHEHGFGFLGHSLAGRIGGALSGTFLQSAAITIVTGSGSQNPPTTVELAVACRSRLKSGRGARLKQWLRKSQPGGRA